MCPRAERGCPRCMAGERPFRTGLVAARLPGGGFSFSAERALMMPTLFLIQPDGAGRAAESGEGGAGRAPAVREALSREA